MNVTKIILFLVLGLSVGVATMSVISKTKTFHDFSAKNIDGKTVPFSIFKGKKVLVVNVASECGYTPQYTDLEQLSQKYQGKLVVVGFPANNFGQQEPGSNLEIKAFCSSKYAITFPMMEKISVIGPDAHPLYRWLSNKAENGVQDGAPKWNFTKYLIDENGKLIQRFDSNVKPLSAELKKAIEG
jgi:glutathione peroxidase